jgi:hypothetical protein
MYTKLIAMAAIAVAATVVTGLAAAGGAATRQEIAFTYSNGNASKMALTPLTSGSVLSDSGSASWCCWSQRTVQQDGEQLDLNNPLATFVGKRGSLTWREQITWHDLTNGYSVASGTWRIVRGTGAYAHLVGRGHVTLIDGAGDKVLTFRAVGLVTP